jgi:hypothetical protein
VRDEWRPGKIRAPAETASAWPSRGSCWQDCLSWLTGTRAGPAAILSLALRYDLTSYDAAYLELALRLQLPIATQDAALMEEARAVGVGVLKTVGASTEL